QPRIRPQGREARRAGYEAGSAGGAGEIPGGRDQRASKWQVVAEDAFDQCAVVRKLEPVIQTSDAAAARQLRCKRDRSVGAICPVGVLAVGRIKIPTRTGVIVVDGGSG